MDVRKWLWAALVAVSVGGCTGTTGAGSGSTNTGGTSGSTGTDSSTSTGTGSTGDTGSTGATTQGSTGGTGSTGHDGTDDQTNDLQCDETNNRARCDADHAISDNCGTPNDEFDFLLLRRVRYLRGRHPRNPCLCSSVVGRG